MDSKQSLSEWSIFSVYEHEVGVFRITKAKSWLDKSYFYGKCLAYEWKSSSSYVRHVHE